MGEPPLEIVAYSSRRFAPFRLTQDTVAKKAAPILDLYAGRWEGQALGPKDFVLSSDEKTSIQARRRWHTETPPRPRRRRRIEPEYKRMGALQYLAAWDVGRGMVLGRCEAKTGIEPFGRLVDQILDQEPYSEAERLFLIVDNGSSHRGQASVRAAASEGSAIDRGAYTRPRQLAKPGRDLFLNPPEESPDAQRFRGSRRVADSAPAVRGTNEPTAQTVRVEVHSPEIGRLAKTGLAAFPSREGWISRRPVKPRR